MNRSKTEYMVAASFNLRKEVLVAAAFKLRQQTQAKACGYLAYTLARDKREISV